MDEELERLKPPTNRDKGLTKKKEVNIRGYKDNFHKEYANLVHVSFCISLHRREIYGGCRIQ